MTISVLIKPWEDTAARHRKAVIKTKRSVPRAGEDMEEQTRIQFWWKWKALQLLWRQCSSASLGQRLHTQLHPVTCSRQWSDSYSKENRILDFAAEKNFRSSRYGAEFKNRFHCRFKPEVTRQAVSIGWDAPSVDRGIARE